MALQITKVNTPTWLFPYKCPYTMDPDSITVHETGNFATAMAEVSYMLSNTNEVSYHMAVDDIRAVQGLLLNRNGWHSGDGQGNGNRKSIAFEICYNYRNGQLTNNDATYNAKYLKARSNAIEIIAQTCVDQKIVPKQGVTLFRHYDRNKKNCPQRIIAEGYWTTFCNEVVKRYNALKGNKPSNEFDINNYHTKKFSQIEVIKEDYAYKEKSLKTKKEKCKKGTILTVTGIEYSGKYPRFKLKSGLYITTRKDTVKEFKKTSSGNKNKVVKVGSTVKLHAHATHYQTGQKIPNFVKQSSYKVLQIQKLPKKQSKSNYKYLLSGINSWVLGQDIYGI